MSTSDELRTELLTSIEARDADALERALGRVHAAGLPPDLADVLAIILGLPWHTRHEDIAGALQRIRSPLAVDALASAATAAHEYLDYDESFGLARKCIWALADIGTQVAREKLVELAANAHSTIAGFAKKRLEHWEQELPRKRREP